MIIGLILVSVFIVVVHNGCTGTAVPASPRLQGGEHVTVLLVGRLGVVNGLLGLHRVC